MANDINRMRIMNGGVDGRTSPVIAEGRSAPVPVTHRFAIQSLFDQAAVSNGSQRVLVQPNNQEIVNAQVRNDAGYSLGLAPWSQTPVAVRFKAGGSTGGSGVMILKPGQIVKPQGKAPPGRDGKQTPSNFNGFEFGLPFGWLGGGLATLFVFGSADAEMKWDATNAEVLFHCQQVRVRENSLDPPVPAQGTAANWPVKFPWTKLFRNDIVSGGALQQQGQPSMAIVETTRVVLRLRQPAQNNYENCRAVLWGTDQFDHLVDGLAVDTSLNGFYDFSWPNPVANGYLPHMPVVNLPTWLFANGGDDAIFTLEAPTGSTLIGADVDVIRFGRLG